MQSGNIVLMNSFLFILGFAVSSDLSDLTFATMGWALTGLGVALVIVIAAGATLVLCRR